MPTNILIEAERNIDQWRGTLCPTCQQPSQQRFCSAECRRVWVEAYKEWLKSEGRYQPATINP